MKFGNWTVLEKIGDKSRCVCVCGKEKMVNNWTLKAGKSTSCGCRRAETLRERYGVSNISQIQDVKDKKKETFLKRHGVSSPFQCPSAKETLMERYGVDHNMKIKEVQDKKKATFLEKYGHESPMNNDKVKEKLRKVMKDRYGVEHSLQNPESRKKHQETCLERYSVSNPVYLRDDLIILSNGMALHEFIKKNGIKTNWPYNLYRRRGEAAALEFIKNYHKKTTSLERKFIEIMRDTIELEHYNRAPLNAPSLTRKKPDFKINSNTYVNVDGLYWHSEAEKPNDYHVNLRKLFENEGLRLLQFYEDEVFQKSDIVRSIVCNVAGLSKEISINNLTDYPISDEEAEEFFNKNHLLGFKEAHTHIALGRDVPLAALSLKYYAREVEIVRFCYKNNTVVKDGLKRLLDALFNYIPKNTKKITTYIDNRFSVDKTLLKQGFSKEGESVNFEWTDGYLRKSESEENLLKIFDAGTFKLSKAL